MPTALGQIPANWLEVPFEALATAAGIPLLLESSVKAGLDLQ